MSHFASDHLGSIRAVLNEESRITNAQDYDAWGYILENRSDNPGNSRYKFTGKERDKDLENNYDYFGVRYYDARIGRWGGVEPKMSDHPSLSTYSYCSNNPLIRIDLFGLDDIYYKSGSTVHNPEVVKTDEPDRYFIEHDEGNVDVNAKAVSGNTISGQFFEVNSFQTISKYFEEKGENSTYDPKDVDVNWEKEGYPERFNEAIPGFFDPTPSAIYAGIQSLPGKNMDQKKNLQGDKIYIFGKIGYNFQEAGNIVWGAAMNYLHFGLSPSLNLANKFTRYSQGRDDQPNEQEAIIVGWEHFQKSGKNRRLFW